MFVGKILVNCQMGVSRSSAAVLAYLMLRHQLTAVEALIEVTHITLLCLGGKVGQG